MAAEAISGDICRWVGVARALAPDPTLPSLDQPPAALSPATSPRGDLVVELSAALGRIVPDRQIGASLTRRGQEAR